MKHRKIYIRMGLYSSNCSSCTDKNVFETHILLLGIRRTVRTGVWFGHSSLLEYGIQKP